MKKTILLLGFLLAVYGFLNAGTVKILPIGDSITEGNPDGGENSGAWRTPLYRMLHEAGLDTRFVGSRYTADPALPEKQRGHCGKGGFSIGPDRNWLGNSNGELMDYLSVEHDVIIIMLGRNEYIGQTDPGRSSIQYWNYLNRIYHKEPNAIIYTVSVPPMRGENADTNPINLTDGAINGLNKDLPGIVNSFRSQGKEIYFIDIQPSVSGLGYHDYPTTDNVHPNQQGYEKIAKCIFDAVKDNLAYLSGNGAKPEMLPLEGTFEIAEQDIYSFYQETDETPLSVVPYEINFRDPWKNPLYEWELKDISYTDWGDFKFDPYGTRFLRLRSEEYTDGEGTKQPGHLYNGHYYLETKVKWGTPTGEFRIYLSYDKTAEATNQFEKAQYTAIRVFPSSGRICLSKRMDNVYVFQQEYNLGFAMQGEWTFKVYDEDNGVSVYAQDAAGNCFCLFEKAPIHIPTGEFMLEGLWTDVSPFTVKIKPVAEAEAKPETGVKVTAVTLDRTDVTLTVVDAVKLTATVFPENASNRMLKWSSEHPEVATVSSDGTVQGKSEGETNITVTTVDGGYKAQCRVTVTAVEAGDEGIEIPELGEVLYQSTFNSLEDEGDYWTFGDHAFAENGYLAYATPGERGQNCWSTTQMLFTGDYQICFNLRTPSPHHYGEIRFCMKDDANYYFLKVTGGNHIELHEVKDNQWKQLLWRDDFDNRTEYRYTINLFGSTLEISRMLPDGGRRENIWLAEDIENTDGRLAFAAGPWWDQTRLGKVLVTRFGKFTTGMKKNGTEQFAIWPNPVKDKLYYSSALQVQKAEVYDAAGHCVYSVSGLGYVSMETLPAGCYILVLRMYDGQQCVVRVVKD